uniref:Ig-like domain-containing protein n=1 Tax=Astatotilapia calliptera TaxID=8154 RepID=A0A3P8QCH9_ASTCA
MYFYFSLRKRSAQNGALLYANLGDNVTFHCSFASRAKYLSWYKQVIGESPRVISSFYKHLLNSNSFHPGFKNNQRISVDSGEDFYRLNIFNVQDSDSAMYYCGQTSISVTKFDDGTFLVLRGNVRNICVKTETYYSFFHPLIFLFCLLYVAFYVFAVKQDKAVPVLVKTVVAALVVSVIFNVIFCGTLCKIVQRKKCPSKGNYCLS